MRKEEPSTGRVLFRGFLLCIVAIMTLLALLVIGWIKLGDINGRIHRDEAITCSIQARGLQAKQYLVPALDGIHQLLTLPPSPQQHQQQQRLPPKVLQHELAIVASLNKNLTGYVRIEKSLPNTRTC